MRLKTAQRKVLEYLQKHGPANTFRLSRHLKIERIELINIIRELEIQGLAEFKRGVVIRLDKEPLEKDFVVITPAQAIYLMKSSK